MEILFFGRLAEITGSNSMTINHATDSNTLAAMLHEKFPGLKNTKYVMAVDKNVITGNTILSANNSIALLPPFSGG